MQGAMITLVKAGIGMAIKGIKIFWNVNGENEDGYLSEGHTFD